jgi:hypothetical protein
MLFANTSSVLLPCRLPHHSLPVEVSDLFKRALQTNADTVRSFFSCTLKTLAVTVDHLCVAHFPTTLG